MLELPTLEYGNLRFTIMVYDDNGAIGQDSYVGQFIEYEPQNPTATISYVSGEDEEGYLDDLFNEGQVIVSTDNDDLDNEIVLPFTEGSYEITLSAVQSDSNILPQELEYQWDIEYYWGEIDYDTEEVVILVEGGGSEVGITLTTTNVDGLQENIDLYFYMGEEEEEEEPSENPILVSFSNEINGWTENDDTGEIDVYRDNITNYNGIGNSFYVICDVQPFISTDFSHWKRSSYWLHDNENGDAGDLLSGSSWTIDNLPLYHVQNMSYWFNTSGIDSNEFFHLYELFIEDGIKIAEIRVNLRYMHDSDGTEYED